MLSDTLLPQCYPNYQTVHRRYQKWCQSEILRDVLVDLTNELRAQEALDESECFIDSTFTRAKGGGDESGKGLTIIAFVDRHGLPLSVNTHAANHH